MLSPKTIEIVKATVPVLQQHGEAITRHFYPLMFRERPEVKAFFNEAHQAHGSQPRALAHAVLAYAANIDRLQELAGELPRIIHKHVALGVQPQHYPIVGEYLLRAIREVLGAAATDEVINAWGEAYGLLAKVLIDAEEQVYAENAGRPGGWRGARTFRVVRREVESELITSFYLAPADGGTLPAYRPGQYLTLLLDIDGQPTRRNYSLSGAPGQDNWRISVKREPGGKVSNWLHDHAQVGTELQVLQPAGDFTLDEEESHRPLLLITGGVGITPAMSMLETLADTGRPIHFLHAARHGGVHAFRERVQALATQHPNVQAFFLYDEPRAGDKPHGVGRLTPEVLAQHLPADRDVDLYFLGPKPFMQSVRKHALALGVHPERLRWEFFGPLEALDAA
ncbi:NO-inducible flavohemoprotein [Azohydromonas caseinilytica]|uniref:Flavohemoprotein n=1 Tax=Azohydromonas caseinilytica TaxID=2728836 RepID=A0A848FBS5_9BURK|nr:NO-inducible flavohemoprotein [Azohydromonas caseinilytica]NML15421.1 NO-inducible flavohemoprotein [Azohydromonas caseinilytica]